MIIKNSIFAGSSTNINGKPGRKAPEFAFIGRSNVGKSSLINMLCNKKDLAKTSSTPGKTLLINHFIINDNWYLVDLPGYGFAKISKKNQVVIKKMIEDFVSHSEELVTLFVLIDSRHGLMEIDRNFISAITDAGIDFAIILTKTDKLTSRAKAVVKKNISTELDTFRPDIPIFASSSEKGIGKDEILDFIDNKIKTLII